MHDLASSAQIKRLLVRAPESDYEILLGNSLLGQVGMLAAEVQLGRKVVVASDSNVASLYGAKVLASLSTLTQEQIACGMAEIIKAGIIADPRLFALIEECTPGETDYLEVLLRAVIIKRDIVERDPFEAGERALLNLGHTFGHAFER